MYEPVISLWNKGRGTFVHAMMEIDPDPPDWMIRERRAYRMVGDTKVTGKPDEIDTKYKMLIDYKSKDNLPKKRDDAHEFQFNIYAWLLRGGKWSPSREHSVGDQDINLDIEVIAAHYLTWKTKTDKAWLKMKYPVWSDEKTTELITERLKPLTDWKTYGILPSCDPYIPARYWTCQCEKYEQQLLERGITVE